EILEGFLRVPSERRHSDSDHTHIGTFTHFKPPAIYVWARLERSNRHAMGKMRWSRTAGQLTFRIKQPNRRPHMMPFASERSALMRTEALGRFDTVRARSGCVSHGKFRV